LHVAALMRIYKAWGLHLGGARWARRNFAFAHRRIEA